MLSPKATLTTRKRLIGDLMADLNASPLLRKVAKCLAIVIHHDTDFCGKPYCIYHAQHVSDCPCPPESDWLKAKLQPPSQENRIDSILVFLARNDAIAPPFLKDQDE